MESENYIVVGRECHTCTACCKELAILEEEIKKLPGEICIHCNDGHGCGIYKTRPKVCRTYNCLWRSLPEMNDTWRPDLSGILMIPADVAPHLHGQHFDSQNGVTLILIGDPEILQTDRFASMVAGFIESGTAVYLDVPRGIGMFSNSSFLNDALMSAIAARQLATVKALIWHCYQTLITSPPVKLTIGL